MATKLDMAKYIKENSGETENWGDLDTMTYVELKKIYDYLQKAKKLDEVENEDVIGEDDIDNESVVGVAKPNPKMVQEYITIDKKPDHLSMAERRAYARSGILPKIKVKKYDRFDKEKVKFGF